MKPYIRSLILFILLLPLAACYRMTIQDAQAEIDNPKAFVEFRDGGRWSHYVVGGIIPLKNGRVDKICDGNKDFETLHMRTTFLNSVLWSLTGSWYNPQSVSVVCATQKHDASKTDELE